MIRIVFSIFVVLVALSSYRADNLFDVWLTPDQQGEFYYQQGEYAKAAQRYEDPYRKGLAYYAAEDFIAARTTLQALETPEAQFYIGNANAHQGRLAEAITAYEQALEANPEFEAAAFNLDYVQGLKELDEKEYEDAGGTGGKLKADKVVYDDKAKNAVGEVGAERMKAEGMSDETLQAMWMRRVQTTPGDFLAMKFAYQLGNEEAP